MSHKIELELDTDSLESLPPRVLRQIIRAGMGKRVKKKMQEAEYDEEEDDEAEEERNKLVDAVEEQRGAPPKIEVQKDDLPPGVGDKLAKKKKSS